MAGGTWLKGDCSPLRTGGDVEELLLLSPFVDVDDELKLSRSPKPLLFDELVFIPLLKKTNSHYNRKDTYTQKSEGKSQTTYLELKSEPLETVDVSQTLESDSDDEVLPEELSALLVERCGTDNRSNMPFLCM